MSICLDCRTARIFRLLKSLLTGLILLTAFERMAAQNIDADLVKKINPRYPDAGYWNFMSNSTYITSTAVPVSLLVAGFIEKRADLKRASYTIFGGIVAEVILSETMKKIIDRQRPGEKYPAEIFPYRDVHGGSFPSGHTSMAFATATGLSLQFRKWYIVAPSYLWAASVGYSRIYLGVHYPSDVLAGALVGVGSAYLAWWLNKKLFINKNRH